MPGNPRAPGDEIAEAGMPASGMCTLAGAVNGLYKTELIRRRGPWRTIEQVELVTLEYVWWWNDLPLHGECEMRTPMDVEAAYYADLESAQPTLVSQGSR